MQDTHHLNLGRSPFVLTTTRNTARNAKTPGQKARILSCVSGRCVFSHGHFGFHKKSAAPMCMILVISWEARRRAEAIKATKATQATNLMVFPAVSDHSRLLVRLAFIGRPRWGLRSRELVVRYLRHLLMNSRIL